MKRPRDHLRSRHRLVYNPASHRLRELERVISYRHGTLLDTDDADIYLIPVAQTLRCIFEKRYGPATTVDVLDRLKVWAQLWTPLVTKNQLEDSAREAMRRQKLDKADALAARLKLTYADRMLLRITSIGACDVDKAGRTRRRKEKKRARDRARAAARRAERGAVIRTQYLAQSLSRARPWESEGISRRTWERRRRKAARNGDGTSVVASWSPSTHSYQNGDGLATLHNIDRQRARRLTPGMFGKRRGPPRGSGNERTPALIEAAQAGRLPLDSMLRVMRDPKTPARRQDEMAKAAAPYLPPRLVSIEHSGSQQEPIVTG
jgi:hypothetical protein